MKVATTPEGLRAVTEGSRVRGDTFFAHDYGRVQRGNVSSRSLALAARVHSQYGHVKHMGRPERPSAAVTGGKRRKKKKKRSSGGAADGEIMEVEEDETPNTRELLDQLVGPAGGVSKSKALSSGPTHALAVATQRHAHGGASIEGLDEEARRSSELIMQKKAAVTAKPRWHAPWKLTHVRSAHNGWVKSLAVDPANKFFVSGSEDSTIIVWDMAAKSRLLTLTGHTMSVSGLDVSSRQPYLFSCSLDRTVKVWDLETNAVIRQLYGHMSGVTCVKTHPTVDVVVSGGRDSSVRVWDIRSGEEVHRLLGHTSTILDISTQGVDPQVISSSHDGTIKLWDIRNGKCISTLTNHKKGVKSIALHPKEFTFASASADSIKQWVLPEGNFMQNFAPRERRAIINTLSLNHDDVLVSGSDNGEIHFWDWRTGYNFQRYKAPQQAGTLAAEASVICSTFDRSGTRLIIGNGDKSIHVMAQDPEATEETHPITDWVETLSQSSYR